jgi:hypothetical protein
MSASPAVIIHAARRRLARLALAAGLCAAPALAAAAPADAAILRYSFGNVGCTMIEHNGYGVGLPTYMPVVRAVDATRRRDVQSVSVRTDLYKLNLATDRLELVARGDIFDGLAADNNYVVSFRNRRTGATQFVREQLQWVLYTNGFYRVAQYITWHRNGRVPGLSRSRWLYHSPGYLDGKYCFVR